MAHDLSARIVSPLSHLNINKKPYEWSPLDWRGLKFPNRLGLAGGADKDAYGIKGWWRFGAGFIEVGTVTPEPQDPNPGIKVLRDPQNKNLWNQLGFPSHGSKAVQTRLEKLKRPFPSPLFVNIGKNRNTPLDQAHEDYLLLIDGFKDLVDGFVVNISSPNTKDLRQLLEPQHFSAFLGKLDNAFVKSGKPCLIKFSPDLDDETITQLLDISLEHKIDGWILTNTTLARPDGGQFPSHGGVSGSFLKKRSLEILKNTVLHLGPRKQDRLIVSVGGVMSPQDVSERLELGADLVQIYSALIFHGPNFFRQVHQWQQRQQK